MSDGIDIANGGAVAVDTASLDHVAAGLDQVVDDLRGIADRAHRARDLLVAAAGPSGGAGIATAQAACSAVDAAGDRAQDIVRSLHEASHVYAIVELTNERAAALAAGDPSRADAAGVRLLAARTADPTAARDADLAMTLWRTRWAVAAAGDASDPFRQFDPLALPGLGLLLPAAITAAGRGFVPRGAAPTGPVPTVAVRPIGVAATPCLPPTSVAAALSRIPAGMPDDDDLDGAARIRVEAATMPDGGREYTIYLSGTQEWVPGTDDPFDIDSDRQLYFGQDSASLEAARAALAQAGAGPGDALSIVGFSQGALVGAYLAQDPAYDVKATLFAGSPVTTDLPPDVLGVSLVHDDDVVAALEGPIAVGPTGSSDSLVVTRTYDPGVDAQDLTVPAHRQDAYVDTARLLDDSADPRVAAVRAFFDRLGTATQVTATEYAATRTG